MKTICIAALAACLIMAFGTLRAAAQQPPAEEPAKDLLDGVAGINRSLTRLVDLLETIRDNQRVELVLRRIELKERRLAPLESRLRSSESRFERIERETGEMESMRARFEDEVAEAVRTGKDTMSRDARLMLDDVEMRLEMLEASRERALAQTREHEDDLAGQRKEIAILDEMLEDLLE